MDRLYELLEREPGVFACASNLPKQYRALRHSIVGKSGILSDGESATRCRRAGKDACAAGKIRKQIQEEPRRRGASAFLDCKQLQFVQGSGPILAEQARERAISQQFSAGLAVRAIVGFVIG